MNPKAMAPYGRALLDFFHGHSDARLTVRREDGLEVVFPVSHFFRTLSQFSAIEVAALDHCRGHVLDVGAGTGLHCLELQSMGHTVTAVDICPEVAEIMRNRGVQQLICDEIHSFRGGPFDTLLMLGHGIGMVEDLRGLERFLLHAQSLTRAGGRLLFDSQDVRLTDDPVHLAYQTAIREEGRYFGEIRIQFEYGGQTGPYCGWLHVDPQTLRQQAEPAGWDCEVVRQEKTGNYLICLTATGTGMGVSTGSPETGR